MTVEFGETLKGAKFIYFDVGNVLFSFSGGLESLSKKFNVSLERIRSFWRSRDDDICRGILKPQDFWAQMKSEFRYSGGDINFVDFWIRHFRKIDKGHDLANELSKNFQLGLLTNAYPGVVERVLNTDLMPKINWSFVIKSCDVGLVKPERELFDVASQRTRFKAQEIVLIDDLLDNCIKAEEFGWRSINFQ